MIVLLWIAIGVTLNFSAGARHADFALAWWPWGAEASAARAYELAQVEPQNRNREARLAEAEALATRALRREPVNVVAARTLGFVAAQRGQETQADQWFRYAHALSRRDVPTEMWTIERSVERGDTREALDHYDHALRTSRAAGDILFPILQVAVEDPAVAGPLGDLLARRPDWGFAFLETAIPQMKNPAAIQTMIQRARLDARLPREQWAVELVLNRLVQLKAYDTAISLLPLVSGRPALSRQLLEDGNFESEASISPFGWVLATDYSLGSFKTLDDRGNHVLTLRSSGGRGGQVAYQFIRLLPGAYTVSGVVGGSGSDRDGVPRLRVNCADSAWYWEGPLPQAGDQPVRFTLPFTVPERCAAQYLTVRMASGADRDAWIDELEIGQAATRGR